MDFEPGKMYVYKNSRGGRGLLRLIKEDRSPVENRPIYEFEMLYPYVDIKKIRLTEDDIARMLDVGGKFEVSEDRKLWAKLMLKA